LLDALACLVVAIDRLNERVGRAVAWATLAMVLITFLVVVLRYVFSLGWVWMQESYVWLHGVAFMLGAGYTLLHNGHVRVDIFYRPGSARYKAWVDLFGVVVLLLPVAILVFWVSWDYVLVSWGRFEESREAGGLPGLYLLKTVIWGFSILIILQGVALAGRSVLVLAGRAEFEAPGPAETDAPA
jgi:TRAP-type mannitol/chloroaromatic compound transport system permease small subunit